MKKPKVYDSIKAAAGALGVQASRLSKAKSLGCPAFQNGRVDIEALRRWARENGFPLKPTKAPTKGAPATTALELGAQHALSRLEREEAAEYQRLAEAITAGDQDAVDSAHSKWLRTAEVLRKTDAAVDEARRATGQLIDRDEVVRLLHGFGWIMRCAYESALTNACPKLVGMKSPADAHAPLKMLLDEAAASALAYLGAWEFQQKSFPKWMVEALSADHNEVTAGEFQKTLSHRIEALRLVFELAAEAALDREKGRSWDAVEVQDAIAAGVAAFFRAMEQGFDPLPSKLLGLDSVAIKAQLDAVQAQMRVSVGEALRDIINDD